MNFKEKAYKINHLTKQLNGELNELTKEMMDLVLKSKDLTEKNISFGISELKQLLDEQHPQFRELMNFEFVKTLMQISSLLTPLALDTREVFMTLGVVASVYDRDFMKKVLSDVDSGNKDNCTCQECQKVAEDVVQQAIEIVKKAGK